MGFPELALSYCGLGGTSCPDKVEPLEAQPSPAQQDVGFMNTAAARHWGVNQTSPRLAGEGRLVQKQAHPMCRDDP